MFDKLKSGYARLSPVPGDQSLTQEQVTPLHDDWQNLVDDVTSLIIKRHDELDGCRNYHHKQTQMNEHLRNFSDELNALKADNESPVLERLERLKVS